MTAASDSAFPRESNCRSCRAPIVWLRTNTGHRMPVNADTAQPHDEIFVYGRHVSHFSTCPQRDDWRKRRGGSDE